MKSNLVCVLFFLSVLIQGAIPIKRDSAYEENSQFILANLLVSPGGRWSAVRQIYQSSRDTVLLFDRKKPDTPVFRFIKMNETHSFLGSHAYFISGNKRAEWASLKSLKKKVFDKVHKAAVLSDRSRFYILDEDKNLSVYNESGILLSTCPNVASFQTDQKNVLFAVSKKEGQNILIDFSDGKPLEIYATYRKIRRSHLTDTGRYIAVTEIDEASSKAHFSIVDLKRKSAKSFEACDLKIFDRVEIKEIPQDNALWIDIQLKVLPEKTIPDIWYTADNDLKAKGMGYGESHQFYLWLQNEKQPKNISNKNFEVLVPINRTDYVLAFNPRRNFRYDMRVPQPTLFLYNLQNRSSKEIVTYSREVAVSPDGNHLLSFNAKKEQWVWYDIGNHAHYIIDQKGLEKPVFDNERNSIWFESKNGLFHFDIGLQQGTFLKSTEGKKASISGINSVLLNTMYLIRTSSVSNHTSMLIKLQDDHLAASYLVYQNGKFREGLAPVSNNVREIAFDKTFKKSYTLEENYNMPPKVMFYNSAQRQKEIIYNGNIKDWFAMLIKQQIIEYRNSEGTTLRGVLYYPQHFEPAKKYPMVVSIYQMRSNQANVYQFGRGSIGFDFRGLLKKGYFVYLPDVVFGQKGTGLSALDCVHASLDALADNGNIDHHKIGLTGHSMGGYETNFIATHSDRFAAYLSGSAHSDIIRAYFSYSYHNDLPMTWQFEDGQYALKQPFSTHKELYFQNNPIHYVDQVNAPILLWTGMKDKNVIGDHTMEFYIGLKRYGKQAVALFYQDGEHNLMNSQKENNDLHSRTMEWWDYFLKDKKDVEWINRQMKD